MEETEMTNRTVVITGGGNGIGRAMAEAFARNGDQVVVIGRHEETLRSAAEAIGANCTWQRADVSQREQVAAAVSAIAARFKKIDVLVNNAGYSGFDRGMTQDTPLEQAEGIWNETIGVNLTGAFMMTLAAAPHLARPGGRIINISSDAALTGGIGLRLAGYVAAKAGLLGLTRALAVEYSPQGITVNTIAPGAILGTDMNANLMTDEIVKGIAAQLPVRRAGSSTDVAAAALFLASPDAGFITGELLNVNGGRVFGR
jgi:NAD(P)-dependent dehydrogenase (short-subunit alcohol dehydrogenase family)